MTSRELVQKFKDENKIMENDAIVGMIAYGSRVNHYENDKSDLDIMLINSGENSYFGRQIIDGIIIDVNVDSVNDIGYLIENDRNQNDRYYSSVFNTGLVEKNVDGVVDFFKDMINSRYIGGMEKKKITTSAKVELGSFYQNYMDNLNNSLYENYFYYNLLELIRKNYNYMHNSSRINFTKVYDLFKNNRLMRVYYQLKLPIQDFMSTYLFAIEERNQAKRCEILKKLFAFINIDPNTLDIDENIIKRDLSFNQMKIDAVNFSDKVRKVEEMIISNHSAKDYAYFVLLYHLRSFLIRTNLVDLQELENVFNQALTTFSDDDRIKSLEALFSMIEKKVSIDFSNYLIKKY